MNDTEHDFTGPENSPEGADDHVGDRVADDQPAPERAREIGGRKGPEPIRYGDWEKNGRCIDF